MIRRQTFFLITTVWVGLFACAGWLGAELPETRSGETVSTEAFTLPAGESVVIEFEVTVDSPAAAGVDFVSNQGTVTGNFVTVASVDPDGSPNPSGDDATDTLIGAVPDLTLSKAVQGNPPFVLPGETIVYELTYQNVGTQGATGVVITETVPADTTFNAGASTPGWACVPDASAGSTCTLALGAVAAGAAATTVDFAVDVDSPFTGGVPQIDNTASIADDGTNGADPTPGNNSDSTSTTVVLEADLALTKTVDNPNPLVGEQVTFTVTLSNFGPATAQNVVVDDLLLPAFANPIAVESQGSYDTGTGIWTVGDIDSGSGATLMITVDVLPSASDPMGTGVFIDVFVAGGAFDQALSLSVGPDGDLYVTGGVPTEGVTTDRTIRYDGTTGAFVSNFVGSSGLSLADGVFGPDGNFYVARGDGSVARYDGAGAFIDVFVAGGSGGLGSPAHLDFTAGKLYVSDPGNDAVRIYDGQTGASLGSVVSGGLLAGPVGLSVERTGNLLVANSTDDNVVRVDTSTDQASSVVVAAGSNGLGDVGGLVVGPDSDVYVVDLTNDLVRRYDSTGVFVGDFVTSDLPSPSLDLAFGFDGNLLALGTDGEVARFDGFLTNMATITNVEPDDPDVTNNKDTVAVDYEKLDFGDAPDPFDANDGEYPTRVANDGARHRVPTSPTLYLGSAAPDVEPDGQPTAGADGDDLAGTDDEDGIVFTSPFVEGMTATADVTVTGTGGILNAWVDFNQDGDFVDAGEQIVTDLATVNGTNPISFTVANGVSPGTSYARFRLDSIGGLTSTGLAQDGEVEDLVTPAVAGPDLSLTKTDGGITAEPGDTIAYTLTYTNDGGQAAVGAELTETVPANTTFDAGGSTAGWSCADNAPASSVCTFFIGNIAAGGGSGSATFAVEVINPVPGGTSEITNDATLDVDGVGTFPASDTTPLDLVVDLVVTKDDGDPTVVPGGTVTYTIDYANVGNQDLTGVELTETVPMGSTFDNGGSTAGWVCVPDGNAGSTCTFDVGALAAGANGQVLFAVTLDNPLMGSTLENTVSIADDGFGGEDANPGDNTFTEVTPLDVDGPVVTRIDTVLASGSPGDDLPNCAQVGSPVIGFTVVLEDDVSAIQNADDPTSYVLFTPGPDLEFATFTCDEAPVDDDVVIPIVDVTQTGDPQNPTITLELANVLPDRRYQLFVCPTITDASGNPLGADIDDTDGDEERRRLRVSRFNLLDNAFFDNCPGDPAGLESWMNDAVAPDFVDATPTVDADDSPGSGSAQIFAQAGDMIRFEQCVDVVPNPLPLDFIARIDYNPASAGYNIASLVCTFFDGAACGGAPTGAEPVVAATKLLTPGDVGGFFDIAGQVAVPPNALSASCGVLTAGYDGSDAVDDFVLGVDSLFLGNVVIFADGFESGDTSEWSSTVP